MTYVTHKKLTVAGCETTATILDAGDGTYRVTAIARFPSGNFLTEEDKSGLTYEAAASLMRFWTGS